MTQLQDHKLDEQLRAFLAQSDFAAHGGVVTDLDGTVIHEDQGRLFFPPSVELALRELYVLGRPLMVNSLRFPLSVLRTFGREWYELSRAPIPVISMNGSQLGHVTRTPDDELAFEELAAFPLTAAEVEQVLAGVREMLAGGIKELLLFYYPRDWRRGEVIWTPVPERVLPVKEKYVSASAVTAVELDRLSEELTSTDICMMFLLIDAPEDTLMAYQHTQRANFFTHRGIDKLSGTERLASELGVDLTHSIGAGDTEMDKFLSGVGLAVLVGQNVSHRGLVDTIRLSNSFELGELLFRFAELQRARSR
jgi:hydroxymethylpyrimidine pyrophosphatase-like HAD family hydrolase